MGYEAKHKKCAKVDGFWDHVEKDPGDYEGRHRTDDAHIFKSVFMNCPHCVATLSQQPVSVRLQAPRDRYWSEPVL